MSELDKINLAKKLEMDNKLWEFNNKTQFSYGIYQDNVMMPDQDKKVKEALRIEREHEDELSNQDKRAMLKENSMKHIWALNQIEI